MVKIWCAQPSKNQEQAIASLEMQMHAIQYKDCQEA